MSLLPSPVHIYLSLNIPGSSEDAVTVLQEVTGARSASPVIVEGENYGNRLDLADTDYATLNELAVFVTDLESGPVHENGSLASEFFNVEVSFGEEISNTDQLETVTRLAQALGAKYPVLVGQMDNEDDDLLIYTNVDTSTLVVRQ